LPAGCLSGLKARLLLGLVMRGGKSADVAAAFAPYQ
jgi:L-asparaginase